ncbi:hypothetical protein ACTRXD_20365 [Nitrospira sp. T9]|uniref:hypothetical protein n=1 Tax=unclassified Nitrospira TaxID=2652172 RepID=UPI003F996BC2
MTSATRSWVHKSIRAVLIFLWIFAGPATVGAMVVEEDCQSTSEVPGLSDADLEAINDGVQWLFDMLKNRSPDPVKLGEPITLVNGATYFSLEGSQLAKCYEYLRGTPVSGLRGFTRRMSENGNIHAIYVNADYLGTPDEEDAPRKRYEVVHTAIHEAIHLNSFNQKGFRGGESDPEWTFPSNEHPDRYFLLLDEGTTEMFARMVLYHVMEKNGIGTVIVDRDPDNDDWLPIPIYEYPKNLACAFMGNNDIGIRIWANAYFLGEWREAADGLRSATEGSWTHIRQLGVNSGDYQKNESSYLKVKQLREKYGKLDPWFFPQIEDVSIFYSLPEYSRRYDRALTIEKLF